MGRSRKRPHARSTTRKRNATSEGPSRNKIIRTESVSKTNSKSVSTTIEPAQTRATTKSNSSKKVSKKISKNISKNISKKISKNIETSNAEPPKKKSDKPETVQPNVEAESSKIRLTRQSIASQQKEIIDLSSNISKPHSEKSKEDIEGDEKSPDSSKDLTTQSTDNNVKQISVGIQTFHSCQSPFPTTSTKYSAVDLFNLLPKIVTVPKYKQYVEMMFHYVKKSHCLLLYKLLEKRNNDKPMWKEIVEAQLGSNFLNNFIDKDAAVKNCECSASEIILLVPEYNGTVMPADQFLKTIEELMKMVKNNQLKFLYFLIHTKLTSDVLHNSEFSKNLIQLWFKHCLDWNISLADVEAQYIIFAKHEMVSAVEASALIPVLSIKDDQTDECVMALGNYFKGIERAVAAVNESELRVLYEFARSKIKLSDVYGRNIWLYTFPTLVKKLQSKFGRLETARYCQLLKEPDMKLEQLDAKDLIKLVSKLRPSVNNMHFVMSVFTAASMVKRSDLKLLYGLILQSKVLGYSNDDEFYTDSIENFKSNFVHSISEDDECYSQGLSSIQFLASSLPQINSYHESSDCYSAMDVIALVPKVGKNNEMIPPFLNGVKYAENFVRKSELPFLRYLIKENVMGDYKHWINHQKTKPENTSVELLHMYNIVEFAHELLSYQR